MVCAGVVREQHVELSMCLLLFEEVIAELDSELSMENRNAREMETN